MFNKGTTIIYGSQICTIADIKDITFGKATKNYYVLTPVWDDKNVIYVPTDNDVLVAKMKRILSAQEIHELIKNMPENNTSWIEDDKQRTSEYRAAIDSGNREQIICIIKTLFMHKRELEAKNRKLHAADEALLSRAEKVIYEEFATVLGIKKEDVIPYIAEQIGQ